MSCRHIPSSLPKLAWRNRWDRSRQRSLSSNLRIELGIGANAVEFWVCCLGPSHLGLGTRSGQRGSSWSHRLSIFRELLLSSLGSERVATNELTPQKARCGWQPRSLALFVLAADLLEKAVHGVVRSLAGDVLVTDDDHHLAGKTLPRRARKPGAARIGGKC